MGSGEGRGVSRGAVGATWATVGGVDGMGVASCSGRQPATSTAATNNARGAKRVTTDILTPTLIILGSGGGAKQERVKVTS